MSDGASLACVDSRALFLPCLGGRTGQVRGRVADMPRRFMQAVGAGSGGRYTQGHVAGALRPVAWTKLGAPAGGQASLDGADHAVTRLALPSADHVRVPFHARPGAPLMMRLPAEQGWASGRPERARPSRADVGP